MEQRHKEYLQKYFDSLTPAQIEQYSYCYADYFCADEYNANVCADLILKGEKRASCSMDYWYSHEGDRRPQEGYLTIVTTWSGEPVCIIEITSVSTQKYCDVDESFAAEEGEGDKALQWWREAHWRFFAKECEQLSITPSEDMLLLLERFKVVFPKPVATTDRF